MSETEEHPNQGKVFISYSRKDTDFAHRLHTALAAQGMESWVDWQGIPLTAEWMSEITAAIESADAFLYIISPDSLNSKYCQEELNIGLQNNKKLVPIVCRDPGVNDPIPDKVSATQWTFLRQQDNFEEIIPKLVEAINTDLDWVRQHTRLLQRSVEWQKKKRNSGFLLHGADLEEAEIWRTAASAKETRQITPLQAEYIQASRQEAIRRQRWLLIGVSGALVLTIFLAVMAFYQRGVALDREEARATQQFIAEANGATAVANEQARATQQALAEANAILARDNAATAVANEQARATQQVRAEKNEVLAKQNESLAKQNEARAVEQKQIAVAQNLAAQAKLVQAPNDLHISTLLSIKSWQGYPSIEAEQVLRENLVLLPVVEFALGYTSRVTLLVFRPDGQSLAIAGADNQVAMWDIATGNRLFVLQHDDQVTGIKFSPDGQLVITSSLDKTARVWDVQSGVELQRLRHASPVATLDISPDGEWVVTGSQDGLATVWNLENGRPIQYYRHFGPVTALVFSSRGRLVASTSTGGSVKVWGAFTGREVSELIHYGSIRALTFSADGDWIGTASSDNTARIASAYTGIASNILRHTSVVNDVDFSPDGSLVTSAGADFTIRVWDRKSNQELLRIRHDDVVTDLAFSPDGKWIASISADNTARLWDSHTGVEVAIMPLEGAGSRLSFSPDGNHLVTASGNGDVRVWGLSVIPKNAGRFDLEERGGLVQKATISPDGRWIGAITEDLRLSIWDANQALANGTLGKESLNLQLAFSTLDLNFSQDGAWVAIGSVDQMVHLWNLADRKELTFPQGGVVNVVEFNPQGGTLAAGSGDRRVKVWEIATGENLETVDHLSPVSSLAYSLDGQNLAVGGSGGHVRVWDLTTGRVIVNLLQPAAVQALVFSPDGQWLVVGSVDGSALVWDFQTLTVTGGIGALPSYSLRHTDAVSQIIFSPDGKWLVTASLDQCIRLWDLQNGQELARIPHGNRIQGMSFTSQGNVLLSASGTDLILWDLTRIPLLASNDLIASACSRLFRNFTLQEWRDYIGILEPYDATCPALAASGE